MLFLDEPTTGLDPRHRNEVWDSVRALAADGVTVLLTTQYLEEADQLADDLVVLDRGRVIAAGTPATLKAEVGGQPAARAPAVPRRPPAGHRAGRGAAPGAEQIVGSGGELDRAGAPTRRLLHRVGARLDEAGIAVAELGLRLPSLDDVFLDPHRPTAPRPTEPEEAQEHRACTTTDPPTPLTPRRPPAAAALRHGGTLAWRGIVKTIHSPEALIDVTLQPVIFLLLFVYVFGGAISGDTCDLPAVRAARRARADHRVRLGRHRRRARRRPEDRHLRPVPQPADRPVGPAARARSPPTSSATWRPG